MQRSAAKLIGCKFSVHMALSSGGEPMGPPPHSTGWSGCLSKTLQVSAFSPLRYEVGEISGTPPDLLMSLQSDG